MEEDILNGNNGMIFDAPMEEASYIKVIGVGGGGGNAVNHMYRQGIKGVDFIVCNTDKKSLDQSPVPTKIQLGPGLGAGNNPEKAKKYACEKAEEIKETISKNTKMLFIAAGMGGGTGTGAAPVVAEIAKQVTIDDDVDKILVVAIVTFPLSFEGPKRKKQAEEGINELRKYVDSIIIINNDKLRDFGNMTMRAAFAEADNVLLTAAKGIAEIITVEGHVAVDFCDVNTVMANSGTALMGVGIASGEDRADKAIELASTSVLLNDNDISGAKNILLYFSYDSEHEIRMDEITNVTNYINNLTGDDTDVIWGMGSDDNLGENLSITLIATGFESKKIEGPTGMRTNFEDEKSSKTNTEEPKNVEEPHIVSKPEGMDFFNPAGLGGGSYTDTSFVQPTQTTQQGTPKIHTLDDDPVSHIEKKSNPIVVEDPLNNIAIKQADAQPRIQNEADTATAPQHHQPSDSEIGNTSINANGQIKDMSNLGRISETEAKNRESRIRKMLEKLKTPGGMAELENTPAYALYGKDVDDNEDSSTSSIRPIINGAGCIVMGTPFLTDTPD